MTSGGKFKFTESIIGFEFLTLFIYTVFDYENKQIEFYSDCFVMDSSTNNTLYLFIIINSILCLGNILIILLLLYLQKYNLYL